MTEEKATRASSAPNSKSAQLASMPYRQLFGEPLPEPRAKPDIAAVKQAVAAIEKAPPKPKKPAGAKKAKAKAPRKAPSKKGKPE